jgi:hypothetical protein
MPITLSQAELTKVASFPANYFLEYFALRADNSALITTAASFPANYFLENLALRADNSALVTAMNQKEPWYAPPAAATETVTPILLHTFEQLTWSFTEVELDVFYLATSNVYTDHESSLHRIDLRKWTVIFVKLLGASGQLTQVTIFEAAMAPQIGAAIVAIEHKLDPPLVTLMVGIGIPLSFLTLPVWWYMLQGV